MPFDYYRIFYFVAKYKSFSKAAKILHNNQPNITRCMNIMESELGCTLFIRSIVESNLRQKENSFMHM